jgi:outer membrane protein assembly factor BamC
MTTRNKSHLVKHGLVYALALAGVAGCSSINSMLDGSKIDYKSEAKEKAPTLEIPPDLTQLQRENRYAIPETTNGTATASGYSQQQSARTSPTTTAATVAPKNAQDMHIERDGNQRWLVVKQSPEALWPQLKDFWQDLGFLINIDSPQTGVMETDWAENRAKIPQDFIRSTIGKVFDSMYSTGERDKFRTRVERRADGSTEIYISHRGAEEVLVGQGKDSSVWTPRPVDPDLEAEFLSRLMARLGSEEVVQAKKVVAAAVAQPARSKVVKNGSGGYVEVDESFDRAWRRVGLALDRVGFTVEDRDRTQGLYFVRYVDQDKDAQTKAAEKGFFSRLFSGSGDKTISAQRYRVAVKSTGDVSQVAVLDNDGRPETSAAAGKILSLLNDQLK